MAEASPNASAPLVGAEVPKPLKSLKSTNTCLPLGRMKSALSGSSASAIQPTVTPLPSIPSDRAVLAFGLSESTLIVCSASGSSWTLPLGAQAPGSGVAPAAALPPAAGAGGARWTRPLGTTAATEGSDFSDETCAADTVADT